MPTTAGPAPVVDRPGRVDRRPAPSAQEPPPSAQRRTGLRQALTLIVWLLLAGGLGLAAAEERLVAFWMTIDAGPKAVAMDVIAVTIGALGGPACAASRSPLDQKTASVPSRRIGATFAPSLPGFSRIPHDLPFLRVASPSFDGGQPAAADQIPCRLERLLPVPLRGRAPARDLVAASVGLAQGCPPRLAEAAGRHRADGEEARRNARDPGSEFVKRRGFFRARRPRPRA